MLHDYIFNNFDLMFGVLDDSFLTYIFLCCKFYIYRSKFQNVLPTFGGLKSYLLAKRNIEYIVQYCQEKRKIGTAFQKMEIWFWLIIGGTFCLIFFLIYYCSHVCMIVLLLKFFLYWLMCNFGWLLFVQCAGVRLEVQCG